MRLILYFSAIVCLAACAANTIKDKAASKEIPFKEQYWHLLIEENKDYSKKATRDTLVRNAAVLEPNYPNPFCPSTTISFNVFQPGAIDVVIYDLTGQEVGRTHKDNVQQGHYLAKTKDLHVNSGIYIYSIQLNGIELDRKKMIILR